MLSAHVADDRNLGQPWRVAIWGAVLTLAVGHGAYIVGHGQPPSWDEAQYMSAVAALSDGLRQADPGLCWRAWAGVIDRKAPLMILPAGVAVAAAGGDGPHTARVCLLTLPVMFVALGLLAYRLYGRCLPPAWAALGAWLLVTAPAVTGLAHRFYVELLLLVMVVAFLEAALSLPLILGAQAPPPPSPTTNGSRPGEFRVGPAVWPLAVGSVCDPSTWGRAVWVGLLGGAGCLTKVTFAAIVGPPLVGLWAWRAWRSWRAWPGEAFRAGLAGEALRAAVIAGVIVAVSATWYVRNFGAVMRHVRQASLDPILGYDGLATLSYISQGPFVWVTLTAVGGAIGLLIMAFRGGGISPHIGGSSDSSPPKATTSASETWLVLALLVVTVVVQFTGATSAMLRPTVPWLIGLSALAAAAPWCLAGWAPRGAAALGWAMAALAGVLTTGLCFGMPPLPSWRYEPLVIVDARFALNVPDWYSDTAPLDSRPWPVDEVVALIAADAAHRWPPPANPPPYPPSPDRPAWQTATYDVALNANALVFNDHLFHFAARRQPAWYMTWADAASLGRIRPQYIVDARGLEVLFPGRLTARYMADLPDAIATGQMPYTHLAHLPGPGGSSFDIYVRRLDTTP